MAWGSAREQTTLENSAAYLKTWIERLKSDSRLLISAASHVSDNGTEKTRYVIAQMLAGSACSSQTRTYH